MKAPKLQLIFFRVQKGSLALMQRPLRLSSPAIRFHSPMRWKAQLALRFQIILSEAVVSLSAKCYKRECFVTPRTVIGMIKS